MNVYMCAFMIGLGCAIHRHNCETISIFSLSLSNYLCPPYSWQEKKKVDLGLLLIFFFFLFFSLRVAWHNTRPIKWNKSSEASKEREKREEEEEEERDRGGQKEKIFTLLMHTFIEYIYCVVWECLACAHTYYVRITFCTFLYSFGIYIYLYMVLTMTIDYLFGKWNRMWNNITRQRTEKERKTRNNNNNNNNKVVAIMCRCMWKGRERE